MVRQLMLWRYINWKAMLFNWTINWNLTVSILIVYTYIYKWHTTSHLIIIIIIIIIITLFSEGNLNDLIYTVVRVSMVANMTHVHGYFSKFDNIITITPSRLLNLRERQMFTYITQHKVNFISYCTYLPARKNLRETFLQYTMTMKTRLRPRKWK